MPNVINNMNKHLNTLKNLSDLGMNLNINANDFAINPNMVSDMKQTVNPNINQTFNVDIKIDNVVADNEEQAKAISKKIVEEIIIQFKRELPNKSIPAYNLGFTVF